MSDNEFVWKIKAVDETGKGYKQAEEGFRGFLKRLKTVKREESASGERAFESDLKRGPEGWAELVFGAKASMLGALGEQVAAGTERFASMATQYRMGKATGGQLLEGGISSIPILGDFWRAGRNIREAITGESAYDDLAQRAQGADDDFQEMRKKFFLAMYQDRRSMQEKIYASTAALNISAESGQGFQQRIDELNEHERALRAAAEKDREDTTRNIYAQAGAAQAKLNPQIADLQSAVAIHAEDWRAHQFGFNGPLGNWKEEQESLEDRLHDLGRQRDRLATDAGRAVDKATQDRLTDLNLQIGTVENQKANAEWERQFGAMTFAGGVADRVGGLGPQNAASRKALYQIGLMTWGTGMRRQLENLGYGSDKSDILSQYLTLAADPMVMQRAIGGGPAPLALPGVEALAPGGVGLAAGAREAAFVRNEQFNTAGGATSQRMAQLLQEILDVLKDNKTNTQAQLFNAGSN